MSSTEPPRDDVMEGRIRAAFEPDRMTRSIVEIATVSDRRGRPGRRLITVWIAALGAGALVFGIALGLGAIRRNEPDRPAPTLTTPPITPLPQTLGPAFRAECDRRGTELIRSEPKLPADLRDDLHNDGSAYLPEQALSQLDGVAWLGEGRLNLLCAWAPGGSGTSSVISQRVWLDGIPDHAAAPEMSYATGQLGGWSYVLGGTPAERAVSVEIELSDGSVVAGHPGLFRFAGWWPTRPDVSVRRIAVISDDQRVFVRHGPTVTATRDQLDRGCRRARPTLPPLVMASAFDGIRVYLTEYDELGSLAPRIVVCMLDAADPTAARAPAAPVRFGTGEVKVAADGLVDYFSYTSGVLELPRTGRTLAFAAGLARWSDEVLVDLDGGTLRTRGATCCGGAGSAFAVWRPTTGVRATVDRVEALGRQFQRFTVRKAQITVSTGAQVGIIGISRLPAAKRQWQRSAPDAYRFTLVAHRHWGIPPSGTYTIDVHDGHIVSATASDGSAVTGPELRALPTLSELLELAEQHGDHGEMDAWFDAELGYPLHIWFDVSSESYQLYDVTNFRALHG